MPPASISKFLSARPGRGATGNVVNVGAEAGVSIRTPRAGRDTGEGEFTVDQCRVSIRTPRAGRDLPTRATSTPLIVSIRTPRAGRDAADGAAQDVSPGFYPHAPGGARLTRWSLTSRSRKFLSARPGRGATRVFEGFGINIVVSIRTPRAGRDHRGADKAQAMLRFLSARPGRGATLCAGAERTAPAGFYPHAPGGARPIEREGATL